MSAHLGKPYTLLDVSNPRGYVNSMSVATIQAEVLGLPAQERAKLIDVLWDSLSSPEVQSREAAWAEESERRIDAYETGKLAARDAATVFFELRNTLGK
jgi:putative addiction module component (TIGR02574 family)